MRSRNVCLLIMLYCFVIFLVYVCTGYDYTPGKRDSHVFKHWHLETFYETERCLHFALVVLNALHILTFLSEKHQLFIVCKWK